MRGTTHAMVAGRIDRTFRLYNEKVDMDLFVDDLNACTQSETRGIPAPQEPAQVDCPIVARKGK